MTTRIYRVDLDDHTYRLVSAKSRRKALSHVAESRFDVRLASKQDIHQAAMAGVGIEDADGQELIEQSESPGN